MLNPTREVHLSNIKVNLILEKFCRPMRWLTCLIESYLGLKQAHVCIQL